MSTWEKKENTVAPSRQNSLRSGPGRLRSNNRLCSSQPDLLLVASLLLVAMPFVETTDTKEMEQADRKSKEKGGNKGQEKEVDENEPALSKPDKGELTRLQTVAPIKAGTDSHEWSWNFTSDNQCVLSLVKLYCFAVESAIFGE